jgi:hypothetical protein
MTWGHVNDQISDAALGDRLQMLTDGLHMDPVDERRGGLQNTPSPNHEFIQAAARLLRPQHSQFDFGRAQAGFPVVKLHRR